MKYYGSLNLKVYDRDGKGFQRVVLRPNEGYKFHRDYLPRVMSEFIWRLKDDNPNLEFKAIKIRVNQYDIVPIPLGNA